jgi:hypothetical protein
VGKAGLKAGWKGSIGAAGEGFFIKRENHNPPISGKTILIGGFACFIFNSIPTPH